MHSIAVLGAGTLGSALIAGVLKAGLADGPRLLATVRSPGRAAAVSSRFGIHCTAGANCEAVRDVDLIALSVKPADVADVLEEIRGALRPEQILISLAASVPIRFIEERIGRRTAVFRAVTNTPLMVAAGATALAANSEASVAQCETVTAMFRALGAVTFVDEEQMHAANAIAGCGPAYIYMVIEAMIEGGVKMGLARDASALLAAQTVLGAALLARESGLDPAALCAEVIKPGGATAMAVRELDGMRSKLISAIEAATRHSEVRERKLPGI